MFLVRPILMVPTVYRTVYTCVCIFCMYAFTYCGEFGALATKVASHRAFSNLFRAAGRMEFDRLGFSKV